MQIIRAYTRVYRDNGQVMAYVEFKDKRSTGGIGRIEGAAYDYHGVIVPEGTHMGALFERAIREGHQIGRQVW